MGRLPRNQGKGGQCPPDVIIAIVVVVLILLALLVMLPRMRAQGRGA